MRAPKQRSIPRRTLGEPAACRGPRRRPPSARRGRGALGRNINSSNSLSIVTTSTNRQPFYHGQPVTGGYKQPCESSSRQPPPSSSTSRDQAPRAPAPGDHSRQDQPTIHRSIPQLEPSPAAADKTRTPISETRTPISARDQRPQNTTSESTEANDAGHRVRLAPPPHTTHDAHTGPL